MERTHVLLACLAVLALALCAQAGQRVAYYKEYFVLVVDDQYPLGCGHASLPRACPTSKRTGEIAPDPLAEMAEGLVALQPDAVSDSTPYDDPILLGWWLLCRGESRDV